ncbi:MAG TPA: molybdopterin-binding protein [Blastocatellia bacterium]|nr:molybdopterin-binding protein [Blastocatellia bacterium]
MLYNRRVVNVEIIVIGNELLLGLVQDTNSNYLCRVLRGMGGRVRRVAVLRDEADAIADEVRASLARHTDLLFTCGGLGPTDDDLTLAAIAQALGRRLEINAAARAFVERRYAELAAQGYVSSAAMTEALLKMARLPEGARIIDNPLGAAPAVAITTDAARAVALPGVPAELKAIVEGPLQALLKELFGRGSYREREVLVECGDESRLAPALREVVAAHPEVYIKSRASHFGRGVTFRITLSASAESGEAAERMIVAASDDLSRAFAQAGIHITGDRP